MNSIKNSVNYFNYFTEIEDTFVRRRGKHLLLSPMDWALIEGWKASGVPLHVALRGIEKAFNTHAAKPRQHRTIKSLLYCQEEVEAQYAEWLESQRGAGVGSAEAETNGTSTSGEASTLEPADTGGLPFTRQAILDHLAVCRTSLVEARDARRQRTGDDDLCDTLSRAEGRLREIEESFAGAARPDAEQLEASLTDLENLLNQTLRAVLPPAQLAAQRREAEGQLQPYRNRMERAVYEQTLENLLLKRLREEHRIPRLSLFYL